MLFACFLCLIGFNLSLVLLLPTLTWLIHLMHDVLVYALSSEHGMLRRQRLVQMGGVV